MANYNLGRWLLVAFALVGLALAAPVVSAHGNETIADDAPPSDGHAGDWATGMDGYMTEHMGPGAVEWMESHMGVTHDEMARNTAHQNDHRGMNGQGHC